MIWFFIVSLLLAVSICMTAISIHKCWDIIGEVFAGVAAALILLWIAMVVFIVGANSDLYAEKEKVAVLEKHAVLSAAVNDGSSFDGTAVYLASEIAEYNAKIKTKQMYAESPWTNWFCFDFWHEMPLIEIESGALYAES